MSKNIHILPLVTWCLVTLSLCYGFASCASQVPLDDAYHWPDKSAITATPETASPASSTSHSSASSATSQDSSTSPASPALEYINIQDTTITVRIKR